MGNKSSGAPDMAQTETKVIKESKEGDDDDNMTRKQSSESPESPTTGEPPATWSWRAGHA